MINGMSHEVGDVEDDDPDDDDEKEEEVVVDEEEGGEELNRSAWLPVVAGTNSSFAARTAAGKDVEPTRQQLSDAGNYDDDHDDPHALMQDDHDDNHDDEYGRRVRRGALDFRLRRG
jgi:hypothetical protein